MPSKKHKFFKYLLSGLIFLFAFSSFLISAQASSEGPDYFGEDFIGEEIVLGGKDPRAMATKIINISLGFLGIVAVVIVIIGGFIWMTSEGNEERITKAKEILKAGVIGLVIILSAWGITRFVLKSIGGATGIVSDSDSPDGPGGPLPPGGHNSSCGTIIGGVDGTCSPDDTDCNTGLICNEECLCKYPGEGDPCGSTDSEICSPDNNDCGNHLICSDNCICVYDDNNYAELGEPCNDGSSCNYSEDICNPYHNLICSPSTCTCDNPPIITALSPSGGFCEHDINKPCLSNSDCGGASCDIYTPNAAKGNLITIFGKNFGVFASGAQVALAKKEVDHGDWVCGDNFIDNRDGRSYATVKIGNQCWMAENLKATKYTDGTNILNIITPLADWADNKTGAYSCYNNNPENCEIFGNLYNWYTFSTKDNGGKKLCPEGWHVPSFGEQKDLFNYLSSDSQYWCDNNPQNINKALAANSSYWRTSDVPCSIGLNLSNNNISGFSAMPAGYRTYNNGTFVSNGKLSHFWSSTELNEERARYHRLNFESATVDNYSNPKEYGFPVRCLLDAESSGATSAKLASQINAECDNAWIDEKIIIALPEGFSSGDELEVIVTTADGRSDSSQNNIGPKLRLLKVNNIVRPGLCKISESEAKSNIDNWYYGINLSGATAYFGNSFNNIIGFSPNSFTNETEGVSRIPGMSSGETSTFVRKNLVDSNFLDFRKLPEEPSGPSISFFEPESGAPGQYVSIYGGGFGKNQGSSKVYFKNSIDSSNIEADFSFPSVCLQNVWSNKQIIVKVPENIDNGDYNISLEISSWPEVISNNTFKVNNEEELRPSLCKISPVFGPHNSLVSFWGEYFGDNAKAIFSNNKYSVEIGVDRENSADKIKVGVPVEAISGPVKILGDASSEAGNSLNFQVAVCSNNNDCGGAEGVCCLPGTAQAGACVSDENECNAAVSENSSFEWTFSTGFSTNTQDLLNIFSCASYDSCPTTAWACPNSPGFCSSYEGGQNIETGSCQKDCGGFSICGEEGENCDYDSNIDRCVLNNNITCSLPKTINYNWGNSLGDVKKSVICKKYNINNNNFFYNEISVSSSCPTIDGFTWTMISPGKCIDVTSPGSASTCSLCDEGFSCKKINSDSEEGRCVTERLCNGDSICYNNRCIKEDSSACQCCCDKSDNAGDRGPNPSCCYPLTCDYECGASANSNSSNNNFGFCSGCFISNNTDTSTRDLACNCSNTQGKYCEINGYPEGACLDCTALKKDSCREHSSTCCWDDKNEVCRGGKSDGSIWGEDSSSLGYCPYYNCDVITPTTCSNAPVINGEYRDTSACNRECSKTCSQFNAFNDCFGVEGCCWKSTVNTTGAPYTSMGFCRGGEAFTGNDEGVAVEGGGSIIGLCKEFSCLTINESKSCYVGFSGQYSLEGDCLENCSNAPSGFGNSCTSLISVSTCNTGSCSLNCLQESGELGIAGLGGDCGACCCDPNRITDQCSAINSNLNCITDKGLCTGDKRGLCCGCRSDSDCVPVGAAPLFVGCAVDTCCKARPKILENTEKNANLDVSPEHGDINVCRNAAIEINFDQRLDNSSIEGNILLLEESSGPCTSGTYFISKKDNYPKNRFFATLKNIFKTPLNFISQTLLKKSLASGPVADKIYCSVLGSISLEHIGNDKTTVYFSPNSLLKAETKYFVVVQGDINLDSSSGVKSIFGIGMKGSGYYSLSNGYWEESSPESTIVFNNVFYKNSYIWDFTTLDIDSEGEGLCVIDYVLTSPSSYLFQTNSNDINENDIDPWHNSFDTVSDRDKVFSAKAYSADNQLLKKTPQYDWTWDWNITNNTLLRRNGGNDVSGWATDGDRILVSVKDGVSDGHSYIKAKVSLTNSSITNIGNGKQGASSAYIFICSNPWPAVDSDGLWSPWRDDNEYGNYNYEFYYCRDSGSSETSDDLPAFLTDIDLTKGNSPIGICSNNPSKTCNLNNNNCPGGGLCLSSFLKETYFFKSRTPRFISDFSVDDMGTGGTLNLIWRSSKELVYKYKIYYSFADGSNKQEKIIPPTVCSLVGPSYLCSIVLDNLINGQSYAVKITALSENLAETNPSIILYGTPTESHIESLGGNIPLNLSAEILSTTEKTIRLSWEAPNNYEVSRYKVYRGVSSLSYGSSFTTNNNNTEITISLSGTENSSHYLAISSIGVSGVESEKSNEIMIDFANESIFYNTDLY